MPRPAPAPEQVILGYQGAVQLVRRRIQTYARAAWASLDGSYRDPDIDRLVEMILPQALAAQRQVAGLTDAYIAAITGAPSLGIDQKLVTGTALRGVSSHEVYRRPALTIYTALAAGKSFGVAVAAGQNRLLSIATTDIQLSKRVQQNLSMESAGVTHYRRVLTGAEDCALCVEASDGLYSTADLLPIHPGCDCDVEPDTDSPSVAQSLNERVDVTDEGRGDVAVHEHGEYGPTLGWAQDEFTGPGDIAA